MNSSDLRTLCAALGFTAVASKDGLSANAAPRARALALLMEEFCRNAAPEAFGEKADNDGAIWSCREEAGSNLIEAANGKGEKAVVAELRAVGQGSAAEIAARIIKAMNGDARKDALIAELSACLEMCLEEGASGRHSGVRELKK